MTARLTGITAISVALECPIDGLPLSNVTARTLTGTLVERDSAKHIHIEFIGTMTCANGHIWQTPEDSTLILERKG